MQYRKTWLILLLVALMALWGCSDDDDDGPVTPPSQTAFEVMAAAGAAYVNDSDPVTGCPGVIDADVVVAALDEYTVIDIRSETDYIAGHIPGAYHSSLSTLMDDLANTIPTGKTYVVACYTGQSAGHAKIAMELSGYEDVKSLLFGMSAWNTSLDRWTANCADNLPTAETDNQNANLTTHAFPSLAESNDTVVAERVAAMLAAGFKGKSYNDLVTDGIDNYFILNYFRQDDYEGDANGDSGVPGHIPGAFQFTPYNSLAMDQMLENLPTDMPIVVYCWTGQHSSQITAYLNMLGYEAYSLKFGSNNLFYGDLTAHKWGAGAQNDYDLETGPMPDPTFKTIADALAAYVNDSDPVTGCPGVIDADDIVTALDEYTIIDIRSEADFNAGHIPGAYHSSLSTLMDDLENTIPTGKTYVLACYTGQSAGHAKIAMELSGYEDVKSLLFGMSAWNTSLDRWTANCANNLPAAETENQNGNLEWYDYPDLGSGATVAGQVEAMLTGGFKGKSYSDLVSDGIDEYFIINYFGQDDYEGDANGDSGVPGHIPGAFQFTPYQSMGIGEMLANIPTDMPVVVYCWTGQHSSQITAYLNMLGYEAYSLKFGSNNLFYDDLAAHKWGAGAQNDYELTDPITVP